MKPVVIDKNEWHPIEDLAEVIDFIKLACAKPEYTPEGGAIPGWTYWSWPLNSQCKYVSINFDMRDGAFTLRDREGNRILLSDLKYQYSQEGEK